MLYPKKCVIRRRNKVLDVLEDVKKSLIGGVKAFSSYGEFILFIEQKLHF